MSINTENYHTYTEDDFDGSNAAPLLIVGPEAQQSLVDRQDALGVNFEAVARQRLSGLVDEDVVAFAATSRLSLYISIWIGNPPPGPPSSA